MEKVNQILAKRLLIVSLFLPVLVGLYLFSAVRPALTKPNAVITVNTLSDTVAPDGLCGLREAILSANDGMPHDSCTTGNAGPDTIIITATGTISLGSALPAIYQDVNVVGPGMNLLIISGNNITRLISVTNGIRVNLSNVTLAKGNSGSENGGGIFNRGVLTISQVTLFNNSAFFGAGIYNHGTLYMTGTIIYSNSSSNYGGGLYSLGVLTMTNSTLYSNTAPSGSGVYNTLGRLSIFNSTIYSNFADISGGGLNNATGGILNIVNSTIANNKVQIGGGGGILNTGALTVTNSTIAGNSNYGIFNGGANSSTLRNTIVANTTSNDNCFGTIKDGGNNLQFGGAAANSCGAGIQTADPKLGPLANNGGSTKTMALKAGSAAIDAGSDANCPSADQRGIARAGAHCDIGAYEFWPTIYLPSVLK